MAEVEIVVKSPIVCDRCKNSPPNYSKCVRDNKLCIHYPPQCEDVTNFVEKQTHADRIRKMSDEDLAVFLEGCICPTHVCKKEKGLDRHKPNDKAVCVGCWLDWLREEAET